MTSIKLLKVQRAFTLAEVIAAISLFAVMAMGIAALMSQTSRVSVRVDERQERILSAQLSVERLSRELAHAYRERLQREESRFVARASPNSYDLIFSSLDSPIRSLFERRSPGVKLLHYFLEPSPKGGLQLMRAEVPLPLAEELETQEARLVADGILSLQFQFYDAKNDQWLDSWDSGTGGSDGESPTVEAGTDIQLGYFPQAVRIKARVVNTEAPEEEWEERALVFQTSVFVLNEYEEMQ